MCGWVLPCDDWWNPEIVGLDESKLEREREAR